MPVLAPVALAASGFSLRLRGAGLLSHEKTLQGLDVWRGRTLAPDENSLGAVLAWRQRVNRQSLARRKRAQDAARQERHAQAGDDAAQQRRIRAKLNRPLRHYAALGVPILQPPAMRAA